ncbi:MAG TPA: alpha/beta fold hydrolase, partial [Gammaproteobacteria bacterium]
MNKTNLLLAHGWGMNSRVWGPSLSLLESRFEVQTVDLPGHGRNAQQPATTTLQDWADAVIAQAAAPAIYIGWSLGGLAALTAAQRQPQRVRGLILVASSPKFAQSPDWPHAIKPELLYKFETALRGDYRQLLEDFILLQSMGASKVRDEARWLRKSLQAGGEPAPWALKAGLEF